MKLSIIIPVYNSEKYIKECVDSIQAAKPSDVELILVDDGSTDKSPEICNKLAKKYNNILVIHQKNMGVSSARNRGLEIASGEYIMFVDADDKLSEDWYNIIEENRKEDIIFISKKLSDLDKKTLVKHIIGYSDDNVGIAGPVSKLYKREFLNKNNIRFKEGIIHGEDLLFNLEVVLKARAIGAIKKSFYKYRITPTSSSKSFNVEIFNSDRKYHIELDRILGSFDFSRKEKDEFELFSKQGACFVFAQKLASFKKYNEVKEYYSIFEEEPYVSALKKELLIPSKYHIFLNMLKRKHYCTNHFILHLIKKILVEREHFLEV